MIILGDMVWPALFIMARYYSWWAILFGLIVEYLALRALTNEKVGRSIFLVLVANAVTAAIGYFVIPWITLLWELLVHTTIYPLLGIHATFNALGWVLNILVISAITAFPEWLIIRAVFKVKCKKMAWLGWWFANSLSVALAVLTLFVWEQQL